MRQIESRIHKRALTIVEGLVVPNYTVNFQPTYPDQDALVAALEELLETTPATTPGQIEAFRNELAHIGSVNGSGSLELVGSCHEEVHLRNPALDIKALTDPILAERATVHAVKPDGLHAQRTAGQSVKPRSNEFEETDEGELILSFFGEGVNSLDPTKRVPDPSRMVAMALQSRDITESLAETLGTHVPVAHEMLLLAYERAFDRLDEQSGKRYLLSADLPWIGVRTNDPNGPHVELLSNVENAVGVKIGPDSDAEHIRQLAQKLNPRGERGKLVFMLRVGDNITKMIEILEAIRDHAPNALVMYDIHGVTKANAVGKKIRCVENVIGQARQLNKLCSAIGPMFIGHHLETTTEERYECVDTPGESPSHPGKVDPRLNNRQLRHVLAEV